jgi:threonine/homoserine/homoserine lactone efflux protein
MDNFSIFAAAGGFVLGMLVWSRVLRWGLTIWTVNKERARDPAHRSRWRVAATVLLNSGPWTFAALIVMAALILPRPHVPAWNIFFYGVLASLGLQALMMVWMVSKMRRYKRSGQERSRGGALRH